ncbi:MAG: hypothetical protein AAFN27_23695 [Pseudomonadota bacterium]
MPNINGNGSDNTLVGTLSDDLIKGRGGNDLINGDAGNDRLKGGAGLDDITDGLGVDRMWGGNDADIFRLVADGDKDFIRDWEDQDTIDLSAWGVTDIADLGFTELSNGQVRIKYGNEVLQIKAMGGAPLIAADFQADDFIFDTPAQVIDFESLSIPDPQFGAPIAFVDPGHAGFTWSSSFYFVEQDDYAATGRPAGSDNRTTGGNVFATNGFGHDVDVSAASNFDFESFTAGAVYNDGMTLRVIGMDDGGFVGEQRFTLNSTRETQITLDDNIFDSVDQVVFQTFGGTLNTDYAGVVGGAPDTTHAYFDDFMIA